MVYFLYVYKRHNRRLVICITIILDRMYVVIHVCLSLYPQPAGTTTRVGISAAMGCCNSGPVETMIAAAPSRIILLSVFAATKSSI